MGLIHVALTLRSFERVDAAYEANFLVDTGATDSMAPASELRRISILPMGRMACELADGSAHECEFGLARIEFMGEVTAGRVLFGPNDVEPLLGVTALESIGITIDPVTQTFKRLPAIPLKFVAAKDPRLARPIRAPRWPPATPPRGPVGSCETPSAGHCIDSAETRS